MQVRLRVTKDNRKNAERNKTFGSIEQASSPRL